MPNQNQGGTQRSQQELEQIIRGGKFTSQSEANTYLQKHGLSAKMKSDGSTEILDEQQNRVATVQVSKDQGDIQSISY